ncbi:hypothetical protein HDU76_013714 [Blyttiomyces sp. JEL0837]|nr:hypothetical protein HDU76_013714 [Blyttiomyces sp. JEL0837]
MNILVALKSRLSTLGLRGSRKLILIVLALSLLAASSLFLSNFSSLRDRYYGSDSTSTTTLEEDDDILNIPDQHHIHHSGSTTGTGSGSSSNGKKNKKASLYYDPVKVGHAKVGLNLKSLLGSHDRGFADEEKMEYIKNMTIHAWKGYKDFAWGHDEVRAIAKQPYDWHSPLQLFHTPIDSLDTFLIMNLKSQYEESKSLILSKLRFDNIDKGVSIFETTIRIVGGLLSAYELEGDKRLLDKVVDLVERMLVGFEEESGFFVNYFPLADGTPPAKSDFNIMLAEVGSIQLEFQYLSDLTGNPIYAQKALFIYEKMFNMTKPMKGLFPTFWNNRATNLQDGVTQKYGIDGMNDSFYEYLLKMYLATGEQRYYDYYMDSAEALLTHMATVEPRNNITYMPKISMSNSWGSTGKSTPSISKEGNMEHLACFAGGMFAVGSKLPQQPHSSSTDNTSNKEQYFNLGDEITKGCVKLGLGPEEMDMGSMLFRQADYRLRPETVESLMYMWRLTHDPYYREKGWAIALAIDKHCRAPDGGYFGLEDVDNPSGKKLDVMHSFFVAETLKYLYLLFTDDDVIPLEKYVFNTEAHPFAVRGHGRRSNPIKLGKIPMTEEDFGRKFFIEKNTEN